MAPKVVNKVVSPVVPGRFRINGSYSAIYEATTKMSSKLRSSFDYRKRKLGGVIYSRHDNFITLKNIFKHLPFFKSLHENV